MGSFQAFVPRSTTILSPETLRDRYVVGGFACQVHHAEDGCAIEFENSADVLHLTIKHGRINYVEHAPAYGAKPIVAGCISDLLDEMGFEWIDEDDPRHR